MTVFGLSWNILCMPRETTEQHSKTKYLGYYLECHIDRTPHRRRLVHMYVDATKVCIVTILGNFTNAVSKGGCRKLR